VLEEWGRDNAELNGKSAGRNNAELSKKAVKG
jgi:hypothetical protein